MGMNAHLHFVVNINLLNKLKEEAKEKGTNISDLCRRKLAEEDRLERIEKMIEELKTSKA